MFDPWRKRCADAGRCWKHVFDPPIRRCTGHISVGRGRCGRGALDLASLSGDGRCGRHILDLRRFHVLRDGCVAGLFHDALGDALLREDDMGRLVSASTRRDLFALWCVADATTHRMANCSWRHNALRRLSRLRRAEHACSSSSPCAAISTMASHLGSAR